MPCARGTRPHVQLAAEVPDCENIVWRQAPSAIAGRDHSPEVPPDAAARLQQLLLPWHSHQIVLHFGVDLGEGHKWSHDVAIAISEFLLSQAAASAL